MPKPAPKPVPEGMHTLTTQLWFDGNCKEAVEFYQRAFGAELAAPVVPGPDGTGVIHAMLKIGDSQLIMADSWPGSWEQGPADRATAGLFLYTEDCDALFIRARDAGCEVLSQMDDMFWGDRMGKLKDPFGHCWGIASHKWLFTPEEIKVGQDKFFQTVAENT